MLIFHCRKDKEQINPQWGQLQEDAPAAETRVKLKDPIQMREWQLPRLLSSHEPRPLPHKSGIDLRGEGVVLKGGDLAEDFGEEQVDRSDGDGGQVLQKEADQPVVSTLKQTRFFTQSFSLFGHPSWVSRVRPPDIQESHLILRHPCGIVDEAEGTDQQTHHGYIEHKPEQVETDPLAQGPLSLALGEALLLKVKLGHRQNRFVRFRLIIYHLW